MVTTIPVYFENNFEELSEISTRNCTDQDSFRLQQDNAPVHVSRVVKQTMSDLDI